MKKKLQLLGVLLFSSASFLAQENRDYDGSQNNLDNPAWGAAQSNFRTLMTVDYTDGISEPGALDRANPRTVSNAIGSQNTFIPNELGLSDFVWGWGQFIDHDINLNDDETTETHNILVPQCDPMFDPACTGTKEIRMFRSISDANTGTSVINPRRHVNEITSYIDGSGVYGVDESVANWLRSNVDGKMKTSSNGLLPWNTIDGEFNSAIDPSAPFMVLDGMPLPERFFVGGDVRVNEQPGLMCFHTLMVREHNRLADEIKVENPNWNDEQIFQRARKIVGALIQAVTYEEFLTNIGVTMSPYNGYDNTVQPDIVNTFSAAGYRFGHTMVNGRLVRFEENGDDWNFGAIDLRNGFFKPTILLEEGGLEPFFRGFAAQKHQLVDPLIMNDIRNFLFGPPGSGGLDLLAINIARARERGVADYNTIRGDLSLTPHTGFEDLTSDASLQQTLEGVYTTIDNVDPWIGFMSEDHISNSIMGEGMNTLLKFQFESLRDGDRYYYENDPAFSADEISEIKNTKLSQIILRNTEIETLQENVFIAVPREQLSVELFPFSGVQNINIKAYPNPVQKYFNIQIEARRPSMATLTIYDVNGVIVQQKQIAIMRGKTEHKFELSDALANGLYVIALDSDAGKGQLKIIKGK
ncbi:hypothetical protein ULMS_18820 [Patiriisocius marinistellae]|uniref:Secretion system C-terminal sorting domain-containing protein n=1 Tax=Patiriisocius marinistellae TaxID=2494560 RepID=A0A5J4FYZ1_9FLAO|nr:peroxidase family protein [Patiriisocius marinistellae]GEQ86374.1 hypothetical protein ULMS_18820 [Patiriisocius marinistellae]